MSKRSKKIAAKFHNAIKDGKTRLVSKMMKKHPDIVNAKSFALGNAPIELAVKYNHLDIVKMLYSALKDNGAEYINFNELLHAAVHVMPRNPGDTDDMIRFLVENGADLNSRDTAGLAPLHITIRKTNNDVMKLLVAMGADPHVTYAAFNEHVKHTPLFLAAEKPNHDAIEVLLAAGADINRGAGYNNRAPLHQAVEQQNPHAVDVLLGAGAKPDVEDATKSTPLFLNARSAGHVPVMKRLIQAGVNPCHTNAIGNTPLHESALAGKWEKLAALLSAGADMFAVNDEGDMPISLLARMHSISTSHGYCIEKYIDAADMAPLHAGALTNDIARLTTAETELRRNNRTLNELSCGATALHFAALAGYADAVDALVSLGAAIDEPDKNGKTPLYYAVRNGDMDIIERLLQAGADPDNANEALCYQFKRYDRSAMRQTPDAIDGAREIYLKKRSKLRDSVNKLMRRDILDKLLSAGMDPNHVNDQRDTLLHVLCRHGAGCEDIELVLRNGADFNARNEHGDTPLVTYVHEHPAPGKDGVKVLLEAGAQAEGDLNKAYRLSQERPLNINDLLIDYGADERAAEVKTTTGKPSLNTGLGLSA